MFVLTVCIWIQVWIIQCNKEVNILMICIIFKIKLLNDSTYCFCNESFTSPVWIFEITYSKQFLILAMILIHAIFYVTVKVKRGTSFEEIVSAGFLLGDSLS